MYSCGLSSFAEKTAAFVRVRQTKRRVGFRKEDGHNGDGDREEAS